MTISRQVAPAAAVLAALLAALPLWAEPPVSRAERRQKVEQAIAKLETRVGDVAPASGLRRAPDADVFLARVQLDMARTLLERQNVPAAEAVTTVAEQALARAAAKRGRQ
jgi:hypothetical protein